MLKNYFPAQPMLHSFVFVTDSGQTIDLAKILHDYYTLNVSSITNAPRQFVAYTFFITADSRKFFCKIVDKPRFIPRVIRSLPPLKNLHQLGFTKISYPIPTASGELFVMHGDILIVLFNYINAPQNYEYDNFMLGQTLAEIHNLTEQLTAPIPGETFRFEDDTVFRKRLTSIIALKSTTLTTLALKELTIKHHDELLLIYDAFLHLGKKCAKSQWQMVITHGDTPGNILVKSPQDIYVIDWDEILLAPAERDLWFLLNNSEFLKGYQSLRAAYEPNQDTINYYVFSRYFNDLIEYWDEILGESNEEHKTTNYEKMKKELFKEEGWLYPHVTKLYYQVLSY